MSGVFVIVGVAVVVWCLMSSTKRMICKDCEWIGETKKKSKGSLGLELILWLCFLIPGLIYTIWRITSRAYFCPMCSGQKMIPIESPLGQQMTQSH